MPIILVSFALAPYAAILGLIYVVLSVRITNMRRRERVALGHNDHAVLERNVRAHANFNEYVPFALLLIWLSGATGTSPILINLMGLMLVLGRIFHAYSILVYEPKYRRYRFRAAGMILTFLVILFAVLLILLGWLGFALR